MGAAITYVLMVQMSQELDFPKSPLCIHVIIKCVGDLLDCNHLSCLRIHHRTTKQTSSRKKKKIKVNAVSRSHGETIQIGSEIFGFVITNSSSSEAINYLPIISLAWEKVKRTRIHEKIVRERDWVPNDPVCAPSNGHDGRLILGSDLEQIVEYVVLKISASVRHHHRKLSRRCSIHLSRSFFFGVGWGGVKK